MNNDANLIFEAYKKRFLVNEMDIGAEHGPMIGAVKAGAAEREKAGSDTYILGKIKKALNISIEEVAEALTKPLYDKLFPGGRFAASGETKDQYSKLQGAIEAALPEIVSILVERYPELKNTAGLTAKAISGYTARILKNFIGTVATVLSDAGGDEAPSEPEVKKAVKVAVKKAATSGDAEAPAAEPEDEAPDASSSDRITVRIEQLIAELIDDSGVNEAGVIKDVTQKVLDSGGLGIKENEIVRKIKVVLNDLIKKQVFERKGQFVKLGKNYEKFEQGGGDSSVLSDEDLITSVTGFGERPKTARSSWGGHGDSMFG
jgi:hypothetical protein